MARIEIIVVLLVVAIPLVGLARTAKVPAPVVLVLGGLVLGFVPGLSRVTLDPQLVLLVFLPPLLYWEAVTAPTDEMRANARWVWTLAIGLTIATIGAVAAVFHALNPAFGWAAAVVLGAVVASCRSWRTCRPCTPGGAACWRWSSPASTSTGARRAC